MKPRASHHKTAALTLVEILVVIVVLAVLAAIVLSALPRKYDWRKYTSCANNLKQVGIAFHWWEGDNNGKSPMHVSLTNGGAMELIATGNVVTTFQVMSNELSTAKIVICPQDMSRDYATNFTTDFNNSRISYFVNADGDEKNQQTMLSGDANFEVSGFRVKSGLLEFYSNAPIAWSAARHKYSGNVLLADGSVQLLSNSGLTNRLNQTAPATNRLAIP